MKTVKEKESDAYTSLKEKYGYKNRMMAPRFEKIVVSSGTGKQAKADKTKNYSIAKKIAKITGQKPVLRGAKQSVASFKIREGDIIGVSVTLRGARMYAFLDKLINITFPRVRDFRGFSRRSVDAMGNCTLGIKEHTIFPETADEDLRDVFGLAITFVTNVKGKEEALDFFETVGLPLKKTDDEKKKRRS